MFRSRYSKQLAALLTGTMALTPVAHGTALAAGSGASIFAAPEGKLVLTRELRRSLAQGKDIVSRRSYDIRFVREGDGWRVDGTLAKAEVEAPAELAMLAELEKTRKDDGLFPLHLDSHGMIVEQQGATDTRTAQSARSAVTTSVAKIEMPQADKAVAGQMVHRIASAVGTVGGNWPVDLFRPVAGPRQQVREVPLPDGKQGRVTVTMQANPDQRGLLEEFQRQVMTELDGTTRMSRETWRLSGEQDGG